VKKTVIKDKAHFILDYSSRFDQFKVNCTSFCVRISLEVRFLKNILTEANYIKPIWPPICLCWLQKVPIQQSALSSFSECFLDRLSNEYL